MGVIRALGLRLCPAVGIAISSTVVASAVVQDAAAQARPDFFHRLDRNGDGVITRAEMSEAGEDRVRRLDGDGDGSVSRREFVHFHERRARQLVRRALARDGDGDGVLARIEASGRLRARFDWIDRDGDGFLTGDEIMAALKERTLDQMNRIFGAFDANGDGRIGPAERVAAVRRRFRRLDVDVDGAVTLAEMMAARGRWRDETDEVTTPPAAERPRR